MDPPVQNNRAQLLSLAVLILSVPVQYLLTKSSNENYRQYEIKRVLTGLSDISQHYLSLKGWIRWCGELWKHYMVGKSEIQAPPEEVLKNQNKRGHFATSTEPRSPRSPAVKYRVGQVIKHKEWGYRGVIVGWDESAKAPDGWLNDMHPADKPEWRKLPNYAVLVDTRDRLTPQMGYVVEENLEVLSNQRIFHPLVEHYFENFDGAQYLPRPWLKSVYPHD